MRDFRAKEETLEQEGKRQPFKYYNHVRNEHREESLSTLTVNPTWIWFVWV